MHNPDQLTDEELIKQERFDELFERHFNFAHYSRFKWPYNIAFKILQNEEQERDAVQKALDRAWRALKAGQFDYRSTFKTWFSTIVRNVARTERSKERKHRSREIRKGDLPTTDGDDDEDLLEWLVKQRLVSVDAIATPGGPDITAIKTIEIKKVREALTSLDDKERKAIILIHFRGLSYREAAKILDVVASTVKYQVEQGIKELKRLLQPNAKDASPATPRLPEFQGHHITLEEYEALPEEKKVHYLESARERNAEWLKLAFQELQAAWLMIIDGQVYKHGPSLQKYPLPDQFLEICRKKGRYPFVFLHPVSITVEEASIRVRMLPIIKDQERA